MKNFGKILAVAALFVAFVGSQYIRDAHAEPTCPGSGQQCATAPDGTVYVKGKEEQQN